ncbi:DUF3006 family protein [Marinilactibacillus kalidii]|uniref:DUF3006 family protein n=1 Tax=Marinilactibacillus kalidii TaxID=2820274 RepID=UPI001ABE7031|nr:DUF3006 family protein [Marinilactibacillus kalidii]
MRVVLESNDGLQALLIPDDLSERIIISSELLPEGSEVGDVLEIEKQTDGNRRFRRLIDETEKRKNRVRSKREKLLKRKH